MVMVRNPKPYKWFIYGYGLVGQNIRPCTPLCMILGQLMHDLYFAKTFEF